MCVCVCGVAHIAITCDKETKSDMYCVHLCTYEYLYEYMYVTREGFACLSVCGVANSAGTCEKEKKFDIHMCLYVTCVLECVLY